MSEEKKYSLKLTAGEINDLVVALVEAEVAVKERSTRFAEWAANDTDPSEADSCQKAAVHCRERAQAFLEIRKLIMAQLSEEAGK